MTNDSSIKYISSMLGYPDSVTDGDLSSIALFRQTFPYFVPARYLEALVYHREDHFSPAMLSSIAPYLGDWILFCDFLENGKDERTQWQDTSAVTPVAEKVTDKRKVEARPPATFVTESFAQAIANETTPAKAIAADIEKAVSNEIHNPVQPLESIVSAMPHPQKGMGNEVSATQAAIDRLKNSMRGQDDIQSEPPAEQEQQTAVPSLSHIVPDQIIPDTQPAKAESINVTQAEIDRLREALLGGNKVTDGVTGEIPVPRREELTEDVKTIFSDHAETVLVPPAMISESETPAPASAPTSDVISPVISKRYVKPGNRAGDALHTDAMGAEPAINPRLSFGAAPAVPHEAKEPLVPNKPIAEPVAQMPGIEALPLAPVPLEIVVVKEKIIEEIHIPVVAPAPTKQEDKAKPSEQEKDPKPLISPVYTDDYFLQQGERIPGDIPSEISELKGLAARYEEDKSLMVMMSFSEWLLHFKSNSQKQEEEKKDQRALRSMWQKEKLAAAMEEENEEIPENVFEMAVNSIAKEDGLASESLADIYIKQEKYDKAIEMYRKLSLRNPQKSAYFARKIEEILKDKQS